MDKLYLIAGIIVGIMLSFCFVMAKKTKSKSGLEAMLCLSMLGVALFKVDLADSKTIQSTFDGLVGIGNVVLGKKATNALIDSVANSIEDIMKEDPDYGSNDNER